MLQRKSNTKLVGNYWESYACMLLEKKGYRIVQRNFRTRFEEIDIIALDAQTLVFVEVKARGSTKKGLPEEAVTEYKLNKIRKAAEFYLLKHPNAPKKQRIEVVAIRSQGKKVLSEKIIKVV